MRETLLHSAPMTLGEGFDSVLRAAQTGAEWALTELYRDLQPSLIRYLRALAPNDAEDVAADAWVGAASGINRFSGDEADFRRWLFTIARRRLIDVRKSAASRRSTPVAHEEIAAPAAADDPAGEAIAAISAEEAVGLIVRTLPSDQAEVILLRVIAGLDATEIAEVTGKRPGTVRVLQHRGLKRLAAKLGRKGVTT